MKTKLAARVSFLALSLIISILFSINSYAVSTLVGHWDGAIELPGTSLNIIVKFTDDGTLAGTIDIPQQKAKDIKLVNIDITGSNASFMIDGVPGDPTFKGDFSEDGDSLKGMFSQNGSEFAFSLKRVDTEAESKSLEERLERLSAFIDTSIVSWNVPGLAVAIVKDGETVYCRGFGSRDLKNNLPVTQNTLFGIGSTTKAMTCACLEMLVEDGLIEWDKPVRTYLPAFKLKDEVATERLNVRDLVTHRSGLARHDLMWYGSPLSRRELFDRLRYLDFCADMRVKFEYNNLMFMTAGLLIEEVTGKTWEEFIKERLFAPLGMDGVTLSVDDSPHMPDYSLPYVHRDNEIVEIPFRNIDSIGPAGAVNASVTDMAKWLTFNLNYGKAGGKNLLSEPSVFDMYTIHTPFGTPIRGDETTLGYGLGWNIVLYHDHLRVEHGGGIDGFVTSVSMLPNDGIGVVVLTNRSTNLAYAVDYYATDLMLGREPMDKSSHLRGHKGYSAGEKNENLPKTTHDLADFTGKYTHPGYGTIKISLEKDVLSCFFNSINSELENSSYDTFGIINERFEGMFLTFNTASDGKITSITIPFDSDIDPIVFTKEPMIREYTVKRANERIVIDGKLDERAWKNASFTENFVIFHNGANSTYETKAQMLWDNDNLYVAFTVEDTDVWATMKNHDDQLWNEETVEIFIDPDGNGSNYLDLKVNPLGTTLDNLMSREYSKGGNSDFKWNLEGFNAAVTVMGKINDQKGKDKGWICEVAIPFASVAFTAPSMKFPPDDGDSWRMNVCRTENIRGEKPSQEAVSWNRTDGRGFNAPDKFGRILFSAESVDKIASAAK